MSRALEDLRKPFALAGDNVNCAHQVLIDPLFGHGAE
jgi:hypothetical protein